MNDEILNMIDYQTSFVSLFAWRLLHIKVSDLSVILMQVVDP